MHIIRYVILALIVAFGLGGVLGAWLLVWFRNRPMPATRGRMERLVNPGDERKKS